MLDFVHFYLHLTPSEYAKLQDIDFQKIKQETKKDPRRKCIHYRKRLALQKSINRFLDRIGCGSKTEDASLDY